MLSQHICIGNDLTLVYTACIDVSHIGLLFCAEAPATIQYLAWANDSKHKLAHGVRHKNQPVAQAFHSCGRLIVHIPVSMFPDAVVGPIQSGRTCAFSAMDVLVERTPIGFGTILNLPPTPMMACGAIPTPVADAVTSCGNPVVVGFTLDDYFICAWGIFLDMLVAVIIFFVLLLVPGAILARVPGLSTVAQQLIGDVFGLVAGTALGEAGLDPGRRFVELHRDLVRQQRALTPEERQHQREVWDRMQRGFPNPNPVPRRGPSGWELVT